MGKPAVHFPGNIVGRLTLLRKVRENGDTRWECLCSCGNTASVSRSHLHETKSCGCLWRERMAEVNTTHGAAKRDAGGRQEPEYAIWKGIVARCFRPTAEHYADYGGRGITMCDEWRESYQAFISYIGSRPSKIHSIDRHPNNDGNYEPGNVRWATKGEQARNTRRNIYVTFGDRTMVVSDWAKEKGIDVKRIYRRLRLGWDAERAFNDPVGPNGTKKRT